MKSLVILTLFMLTLAVSGAGIRPADWSAIVSPSVIGKPSNSSKEAWAPSFKEYSILATNTAIITRSSPTNPISSGATATSFIIKGVFTTLTDEPTYGVLPTAPDKVVVSNTFTALQSEVPQPEHGLNTYDCKTTDKSPLSSDVLKATIWVMSYNVFGYCKIQRSCNCFRGLGTYATASVGFCADPNAGQKPPPRNLAHAVKEFVNECQRDIDGVKRVSGLIKWNDGSSKDFIFYPTHGSEW